MKNIILAIFVAVVMLALIIPLENQLSDCQFECNHLQTKIDRLEALSEYEPALNQLLTPLAWAQLKVANEVLKNQRHKAYEGYEMPLLTEKERE